MGGTRIGSQGAHAAVRGLIRRTMPAAGRAPGGLGCVRPGSASPTSTRPAAQACATHTSSLAYIFTAYHADTAHVNRVRYAKVYIMTDIGSTLITKGLRYSARRNGHTPARSGASCDRGMGDRWAGAWARAVCFWPSSPDPTGVAACGQRGAHQAQRTPAPGIPQIRLGSHPLP